MDDHRFRRGIDPFIPTEDELRAYIEGDTIEDIVRQVSDAFAEELAQIMSQARQKPASAVRPIVGGKRP